jgi:hypothetical protein
MLPLLFAATLCIGSWSLSCAEETSDASVHNKAFALYTDIRPANKTESLTRIRNVEFVNYKFKYDR